MSILQYAYHTIVRKKSFQINAALESQKIDKRRGVSSSKYGKCAAAMCRPWSYPCLISCLFIMIELHKQVDKITKLKKNSLQVALDQLNPTFSKGIK